MSDFEIKLKSFVELTDVANEKVTLKTFLLWEGILLWCCAKGGFLVLVGVPFQFLWNKAEIYCNLFRNCLKTPLRACRARYCLSVSQFLINICPLSGLFTFSIYKMYLLNSAASASPLILSGGNGQIVLLTVVSLPQQWLNLIKTGYKKTALQLWLAGC